MKVLKRQTECEGESGLNTETDNVIMHPVYLFECGEVAYYSFKRLSCHFHL